MNLQKLVISNSIYRNQFSLLYINSRMVQQYLCQVYCTRKCRDTSKLTNTTKETKVEFTELTKFNITCKRLRAIKNARIRNNCTSQQLGKTSLVQSSLPQKAISQTQHIPHANMQDHIAYTSSFQDINIRNTILVSSSEDSLLTLI